MSTRDNARPVDCFPCGPADRDRCQHGCVKLSMRDARGIPPDRTADNYAGMLDDYDPVPSLMARGIVADHADQDHLEVTEAQSMWRYTTSAGDAATVVADSVEFAAAFVVWRDRDRRVVLAEDARNVRRLVDVAALGSTTRGTRSGEPQPGSLAYAQMIADRHGDMGDETEEEVR